MERELAAARAAAEAQRAAEIRLQVAEFQRAKAAAQEHAEHQAAAAQAAAAQQA